MEKTRKVLIAIFIAVFTLVFVACGNSANLDLSTDNQADSVTPIHTEPSETAESRLLGEWEIVRVYDPEHGNWDVAESFRVDQWSIMLLEGGYGFSTMGNFVAPLRYSQINGILSFETAFSIGGRLELFLEGEYQFSNSSSTLTVRGKFYEPDEVVEVVLRKISDVPTNYTNDIVGAWFGLTSGHDMEIIEFFRNGTGELRRYGEVSARFRWNLDGDRLTKTYDDGFRESIDFSIAIGQFLTLSYEFFENTQTGGAMFYRRLETYDTSSIEVSEVTTPSLTIHEQLRDGLIGTWTVLESSMPYGHHFSSFTFLDTGEGVAVTGTNEMRISWLINAYQDLVVIFSDDPWHQINYYGIVSLGADGLTLSHNTFERYTLGLAPYEAVFVRGGVAGGNPALSESLLGSWELVSINGREPWGEEYLIEFFSNGTGVIFDQFSYPDNPPQITWFVEDNLLWVNVPWSESTIESNYSINGSMLTRTFFSGQVNVYHRVN